MVDFDIAVFAVNEEATIQSCIGAIDLACANRSGHISVLLNGTTDETLLRLHEMQLAHAAISVYLFPVADKTNAINHFLYHLRRDATAHFGIDAYTRISPGALNAIVDAFAAEPQALMASGVALNGRSAPVIRQQVLEGRAGIQGNLYAMRPSFIDRMIQARLQLPRQLYRGDSLLGSMAAHDLDAMGKPWDNRRIIGVLDATYEINPLSVFRWRDVKRQYRRQIRQARGYMENEAIKSIIYTKGYRELPDDGDEMIATWLKSNHPRPESLLQRVFIFKALQQIRPGQNRLATPQLVFSRQPGG